jgi:hypothetical protein
VGGGPPGYHAIASRESTAYVPSGGGWREVEGGRWGSRQVEGASGWGWGGDGGEEAGGMEARELEEGQGASGWGGEGDKR